jgi:hypothetical protein
VIQAVGDVSVTVTVDGVESTYPMAAGRRGRSPLQSDMTLSVTDGGAVRLTVNGVDHGSRTPGQPWSDSFSFDERRATPSAGT